LLYSHTAETQNEKETTKKVDATNEPLGDGAHDDGARGGNVSIDVAAGITDVDVVSSVVDPTRVGRSRVVGVGVIAPLGPPPSRRSVLARRFATGARVAGRLRDR
jgi:hypothetical protein